MLLQKKFNNEKHFEIGDPVAAHARAVDFERFSIYAGHDLKTDLNCRLQKFIFSEFLLDGKNATSS